MKVYRFEGAFLDANTTTDAEWLRDPCHFVVLPHLNALLTRSDYWAEFLAFLLALLGLAFVAIDNCDA